MRHAICETCLFLLLEQREFASRWLKRSQAVHAERRQAKTPRRESAEEETPADAGRTECHSKRLDPRLHHRVHSVTDRPSKCHGRYDDPTVHYCGLHFHRRRHQRRRVYDDDGNRVRKSWLAGRVQRSIHGYNSHHCTKLRRTTARAATLVHGRARPRCKVRQRRTAGNEEPRTEFTEGRAV